ncbi:hypothetical protein [Vibrio gallaecicus]|nr:hypothetical protein [Vibrio gallaecicus]MDN3616035.1 hypothetical protein [Vibrio gallaecicus]
MISSFVNHTNVGIIKLQVNLRSRGISKSAAFDFVELQLKQ